MSVWAKYQIEKEIVSTDNGETWTETGQERRGEVIALFPTLAACEDTDCDLMKYEYGAVYMPLPMELCGDHTKPYHVWLPQGIAQEATFSSGIFGCNNMYDSAPAYILNNNGLSNFGSSIKVGTLHKYIRNTSGFEEEFFDIKWQSVTVGKGVVLGYKYDCCSCCLAESCIRLDQYKLYPWVDKDNFLQLGRIKYKRAHCSDEWVFDSVESTGLLLERWVAIARDEEGYITWQHQIASSIYTEEEASGMSENYQNIVKSWENEGEPINELEYLLQWKAQNTNIYNLPVLQNEGDIVIPRLTESGDSEYSWNIHVWLIQDPDARTFGKLIESDRYEYWWNFRDDETGRVRTASAFGYSYIETENIGTELFPVVRAKSDKTRYSTGNGRWETLNMSQQTLNISTDTDVLYADTDWSIYTVSANWSQFITKNTIRPNKGAFITKIYIGNIYGGDEQYKHYLEPVKIEYEWMPQELRDSHNFYYLHDRVDGQNYDEGFHYVYKIGDTWYYDNNTNNIGSATTVMVQDLGNINASWGNVEELYKFSREGGYDDDTFQGVSGSFPKLKKLNIIGVTSLSGSSLISASNSAITTIDIPSSVSAITFDYILGNGVNSENFNKLIIRAETPPTITINQRFFYDNTDIRWDFGIYVPDDSLVAYKNQLPQSLWPYLKPLSLAEKTIKARLTYSNGNSTILYYNDDTTLTQEEIRGGGTSYSSITSVDFAYGYCTEIGDEAFKDCKSLNNVIIPKGIDMIGDGAFYGCSNLDTVTVLGGINTNIGENVFDYSSIESIYMDVTDLVQVSSTDWYQYNSRLKAIQNFKVCTYNSHYPWNGQTKTPINTSTTLSSGEFTNYSNMGLVLGDVVTKIGDSCFRDNSSITSIFQHNDGNNVTSIGNYAFYNCDYLYYIEIPNSVTSIGSYAFAYSDLMWHFKMPSGLTSISEGMFLHCTNLSDITIPNSVTSIGYEAFWGCSGLTSIDIPNSVTTIGQWAFQNCSSLSSVTIGSGVTSMGTKPFDNCTNFKNLTINTKDIGNSWFEGAALSYVTFGNTVETIGNKSFYNCGNLKEINIPSSVTSIGDNAFEGCRSVSSVTIPNCAISVGNGAFSSVYPTNVYLDGTITRSFLSMSSTKNLALGSHVDSDANTLTGVLSYARDLTTLSVESGNTIYDSREDCNAIIETATNTLIKGSNSTVIPTSVTSIRDNAFFDYQNLPSIDIPDSVTSISGSAFAYCSGLTSVTIGSGVTSIGNYAFQNCSSLTSIDIPSSVTSIGSRAFDNCRSLTSIDIPSGVTSIEISTFAGCTSLSSITIPNTVERILAGAFDGTPWLALWRVNPNNLYGNIIYIYDIPYAPTSNTVSSIEFKPTTSRICQFTFRDCKNLSSISIPSGVTWIEAYAFMYVNLSSISVDADNPYLDSRNNCNAVIETSTNKLILGCRNTVIPNTVTSIGTAFAYNGGLTSISIPSSVRELEYEAFGICSALTAVTIAEGLEVIGTRAFAESKLYSVTMPNSVTSIGVGAFQYCTSLSSVDIGSGITSIGSSAFYNCTYLNTVRVRASYPPTLGDNSVFNNTSGNLKIYVPSNSVDAYKVLWSQYASKIYSL